MIWDNGQKKQKFSPIPKEEYTDNVKERIKFIDSQMVEENVEVDEDESKNNNESK